MVAILLCAILHAGFRAVLLFRIGKVFRQYGFRVVAAIIERIMHHACHCWISTSASIGKGFLVAHVGGIVIGGSVVIGSNCDIRQNVTLGGNYNRQDEDGRTQPAVENNVSIGVGAVILGPVKIGTNTIVGANSVVTRDMPSNSIVAGIPAQVIREKWTESEKRGL